jgi:hypothetical protein
MYWAIRWVLSAAKDMQLANRLSKAEVFLLTREAMQSTAITELYGFVAVRYDDSIHTLLKP